ncbi:MAG: hypothetical protein ABA06_04335 [Parcubacteria bacterium C7867-001]|nr:MAG: hypothetical protein ABA06_04335 [Parcubacteria bacterium C7867-001]
MQTQTDYLSLGDQIKHLTQLTEENNKLLKAMRRDKWIALIVNIVFWGVLFYFSYVLTMQFMGPLMSQMGSGSADFQNLIQQYQSQLGK